MCLQILEKFYNNSFSWLFMKALRNLCDHNGLIVEILATKKDLCILIIEKLISDNYRDRMNSLGLVSILIQTIGRRENGTNYVVLADLIRNLHTIQETEVYQTVLQQLFNVLRMLAESPITFPYLVRGSFAMDAAKLLRTKVQNAATKTAILWFL
jgi:hypothetical protein